MKKLFLLFYSLIVFLNSHAQTEPTGPYESYWFKYSYFHNYLRVGKGFMFPDVQPNWNPIAPALTHWQGKFSAYSPYTNTWKNFLLQDDSTGRWLQNIYVRNDSLFRVKNGTETFVYKYTGGVGGGDVASVFGRTGTVTAQAGDYSSFYVPLARTITINGTTQDLSTNRSWTIAGGGSSLLFGKTNEDTLADANRFFNQNGYEFAFKNGTTRFGKRDSIGLRYAKDWSTAISDLTISGTTPTLSGGKHNINGNTTLTSQFYTGVENWHVKQRIITRTKSNAVQKFSIALIPDITAAILTRKATWSLEDTAGYMNYFINSGATTPDASNRNQIYFSWSALDTLDCEFYYRAGKLWATMTNITTGQVSRLDFGVVSAANISQIQIGVNGNFDLIGSFQYFIDEPKPEFVTTGNSLTIGSGATFKYNRWTERLFENYTNNYLVAAGATERSSQLVLRIPEFRDVLKPSYVVLDYGTNDLLNSVTATAFAANIATFVDSMKDNGINPIILSVPPQSINNQTYNDSLVAIATRFNCQYIDINTHLKAGSGGVDRNTKYDKDGIHYNDLGYELWANIVLKNIKSLLKVKPALVVDMLSVTGRAKGYWGITERNEAAFIQAGTDAGYAFNKEWVNGNTIADAQDAAIFIKRSAYIGGDIVGVGAGTTSSPSFKVAKSTGVTSISSAAIGTLNLNGGTFSNSGNRIFMTSGDLVGFQHGLLISRLYPNTGSSYSLRINSDRTGGAPPTGFNILELAENGVTKAYIDKDGYIMADAPTYSTGGYDVIGRNQTSGIWEKVTVSGGSGTDNANLGSGFRVLLPGTQQIKTLFAGTNVTIDSTTNTNGLTISASGGGGGGVTDHGALTGLSDDDHTQYALLAGRSGGQSFYGGTAANNTILLSGNNAASSNTATNPNITFGVGNSGSTVAGQIHNNGVWAFGTVSNANATTYRMVINQLDNTGTNGLVIYPNANTATYMQIGFGTILTNSSTFALTNTGGAIRLNSTSGVYLGGATTPTAFAHVAASTASMASMNITSGTAPTTPNNGDIWHASNNLLVRLNGATKQLNDQASGATYTATVTNVTNIASSTFQSARYIRAGSQVSVSGTITVTPTASGACEIGFSLPFASAFTVSTDAEGDGYGGTGTVVSVTADATNDRLKLTWSAPNTNTIQLTFTCFYTII